MQWRVRPIVDQWPGVMLAVAIMAVAWAIVGLLLQRPLIAAVTVMVVFATFYRLWLPQRCYVGPRGAGWGVRRPSHWIPWQAVSSSCSTPWGLVLITHGPAPRPAWLPWPRDNRQRVMELVRFYLQGDQATEAGPGREQATNQGGPTQ